MKPTRSTPRPILSTSIASRLTARLRAPWAAACLGLAALAPADAQTFTNAGAIIIPNGSPDVSLGPSNPYPASILVAGTVGTIANVTVALTNFSHTYGDDLDILLVGPGGQSVILMSDTGGPFDLVGFNLTFSDAAAAALPDNAPFASGTFRPTNFGGGDTFPAPAPAGPYGSTLAVFNGTSANGTWQLFVQDDLGGDVGAIAGGYALTFATSTPVWDGGGANDNFSTAANWVGDVVPVSGAATPLVFDGSTRLTPNVNAAFQAQSLTFAATAGAFTIGGTYLMLAGIVNDSANEQTINAPIVAPAGLTVDGAGDTTLGGTVSGTTLTKKGAGALTLTGTNTYTDGTVLSAGAILFNNHDALGTGIGTVTLGDAATGASATALLATAPMNYNNGGIGGGAITNDITVSAQGTGTATVGTTAFSGGGANGGFTSTDFTGDLTLHRATTLQGGNDDRTTFTGVISGNVGLLTIAGGARVTLGGVNSNTFTGDVQVTGSGTILQLNGTTNVLPDSANLDLAAGTTLFLAKDTGTETINALTGAGTVTTNIGAVEILTVGAGGGSGIFDGAILDGNGGLELHKSGAGTQTLTGASGYSGGTVIDAGTLLANNAGNSATGSGDIQVNSGGTLGGQRVDGTVYLNSGGTIAPGAVPGAGGILRGTSLVWSPGGTLKLELGTAPERLIINGALTKGGAGSFLVDVADGGGLFNKTHYILAFFASTDFAASDFTLSTTVPGLAGTFTIDADSLDLIIAVAAGGTVIQNIGGPATPVIADFTVSGPVTTGDVADSNRSTRSSSRRTRRWKSPTRRPSRAAACATAAVRRRSPAER